MNPAHISLQLAMTWSWWGSACRQKWSAKHACNERHMAGAGGGKGPKSWIGPRMFPCLGADFFRSIRRAPINIVYDHVPMITTCPPPCPSIGFFCFDNFNTLVRVHSLAWRVESRNMTSACVALLNVGLTRTQSRSPNCGSDDSANKSGSVRLTWANPDLMPEFNSRQMGLWESCADGIDILKTRPVSSALV